MDPKKPTRRTPHVAGDQVEHAIHDDSSQARGAQPLLAREEDTAEDVTGRAGNSSAANRSPSSQPVGIASAQSGAAGLQRYAR